MHGQTFLCLVQWLSARECTGDLYESVRHVIIVGQVYVVQLLCSASAPPGESDHVRPQCLVFLHVSSSSSPRKPSTLSIKVKLDNDRCLIIEEFLFEAHNHRRPRSCTGPSVVSL